MNWKIFLIVIILLISITTIVYIKEYLKFSTNNIFTQNIIDEQFNNLKEKLLNDDSDQKIYINLSEKQFDEIKPIKGKNIYYFPEECPNYKDEIFIYIVNNSLEKYYIPEKNSLIVIDEKHVWTKEPKDFIIRKK